MSVGKAVVRDDSAHKLCFVVFSFVSVFPLLLDMLELTSVASSFFVGLTFEQMDVSLSVIVNLI